MAPGRYDSVVPATLLNLAEDDLHRLQQTLKWVVYTLLLVNFGFYIYEDWDRAIHSLTAEATAARWAAEFATSIDEAGWFILLLMFEIETYVVEDEDWQGWLSRSVHGVRLLCFAMLAHTVYAYGATVVEYAPTRPVENAARLCDIADRDVSFVYNLDYEVVSASNCAELTDADELFWLGNNPVVTNAEGLELERRLAVADLVEAVAWLLIVLAIEVVVRMQGRGITDSVLVTVANGLKTGLYGLLIVIAAWWGTLSHWLYVWDEFLWIAGFAAIEMNVSEWRRELKLDQAGPRSR